MGIGPKAAIIHTEAGGGIVYAYLFGVLLVFVTGLVYLAWIMDYVRWVRQVKTCTSVHWKVRFKHGSLWIILILNTFAGIILLSSAGRRQSHCPGSVLCRDWFSYWMIW